MSAPTRATMSPLARKLALKPGMRAVVMTPPAGFLARLDPLPPGTAVAADLENAPWRFVLRFEIKAAKAARTVPKLLARAAPGAVFWIGYPKKSAGVESDLSRDILWKLLEPMGWRPVSIVAIDETWSALRFRPVAEA